MVFVLAYFLNRKRAKKFQKQRRDLLKASCQAFFHSDAARSFPGLPQLNALLFVVLESRDSPTAGTLPPMSQALLEEFPPSKCPLLHIAAKYDYNNAKDRKELLDMHVKGVLYRAAAAEGFVDKTIPDDICEIFTKVFRNEVNSVDLSGRNLGPSASAILCELLKFNVSVTSVSKVFWTAT